MSARMRSAVALLVVFLAMTNVHGQISLSTSAQTQAITLAKLLDPCPNPVLPNFKLVEATIDDIHAAFMNGTLTCVNLVKAYMQRNTHIDKYIGVNSLEAFNPTVLTTARAMDLQLVQYRRGNGEMPPLFCVPVAIKGNYDVKGMPTTAGATGLLDNFPDQDATLVAQLKAAGAIIFSKVVLSEWAFSGQDSIDSVSGMTRNPYDLTRVAGGSSGGTGTAINANMAMIGMGSDTGGSIRHPAAFNALVGWRPSLGLTSRSGIVPLILHRDTGGPLGRTVRDVAKVANAISVGAVSVTTSPDPRDPITTYPSDNNIDLPSNYTALLTTSGLNGTTIGVYDEILYKPGADARYIETFEATLRTMREMGATIVRNFTLAPYYKVVLDGSEKLWTTYNMTINATEGSAGTSRVLVDGAYESLGTCSVAALDLGDYLDNVAEGGTTSMLKTPKDIAESLLYHPNSYGSLSNYPNVNYTRDNFYESAPGYAFYRCKSCGNFYESECRMRLRNLVVSTMEASNLDAFVFPTFVAPPPLVDQTGVSPVPGDAFMSPWSGIPGLTIPIGYQSEISYGIGNVSLPVSMQFGGKPFSDGMLMKYAYALEQEIMVRKPPATTPECGTGIKPTRITRQLLNEHLARLGYAPRVEHLLDNENNIIVPPGMSELE